MVSKVQAQISRFRLFFAGEGFCGEEEWAFTIQEFFFIIDNIEETI